MSPPCMTSHHEWFMFYMILLNTNNKIYLGDNSHHPIHAKGRITIKLITSDVKTVYKI
jgi:hypothetical protein